MGQSGDSGSTASSPRPKGSVDRVKGSVDHPKGSVDHPQQSVVRPQQSVVRPLQRMVMVTSILSAAGNSGRPAGMLADAVGFHGTDESKREQLARLIRDLRRVGVDITNVADLGQESHWVLHPRDSRIRLAFSPEQQAELARAALLADRTTIASGLGGAHTRGARVEVTVKDLPIDVDLVLRAITTRSVLRFGYNGRTRELDPASLHRSSAGWAVTGFDRGADQLRTYYLTRMTDVTAGPSGSARSVSDHRRDGADPLTWPIDPPQSALVVVDQQYLSDVELLLGAPERSVPTDTTVELTYTVTNRWVFFARLVELGERVMLAGSQPLRSAFADMLRAAIP